MIILKGRLLVAVIDILATLAEVIIRVKWNVVGQSNVSNAPTHSWLVSYPAMLLPFRKLN